MDWRSLRKFLRCWHNDNSRLHIPDMEGGRKKRERRNSKAKYGAMFTTSPTLQKNDRVALLRENNLYRPSVFVSSFLCPSIYFSLHNARNFVIELLLGTEWSRIRLARMQALLAPGRTPEPGMVFPRLTRTKFPPGHERGYPLRE